MYSRWMLIRFTFRKSDAIDFQRNSPKTKGEIRDGSCLVDRVRASERERKRVRKRARGNREEVGKGERRTEPTRRFGAEHVPRRSTKRPEV